MQAAYDRGSLEAVVPLGMMYSDSMEEEEEGGQLDPKKAFECFQTAAELGFPEAYFCLGRYYMLQDDRTSWGGWFELASREPVQGRRDAAVWWALCRYR